MITTEREYRITRARIQNPEQAIARERARADVGPVLRQMYVDALVSSLEEMEAEVRAYEELKAGRVRVESASLAELPTVLIRARIAHGWTQRQLADLLGVAEQTIQRYEATEYQGVAFARLTKIADALSVRVVGMYATAQGAAGTPRCRKPRSSLAGTRDPVAQARPSSRRPYHERVNASSSTPGPRLRVLVTGAEGVIGSVVRTHLSDRFDLRSLTRAPAAFPSHVADIADIEAIRPAFEGVAAVVHLAATPHVSSPWEEVLNSNIVGTRNVFEAAREAGVGRVVFASSNHAIGMAEIESAPAIYALDDTRVIDERAQVRPDSDYGASKAFGEVLGRMYAERFGMRVICLRIGSVLADDDPTGPSPLAGAGWMPWLTDADRRARIRATWLSHRDCAELIRCALEADVRFAIAYGVSDNPRRFWSLDAARELLGFVPVDRAPA